MTAAVQPHPAMSTSVEFTSSQYVRSHGTSPRGFGSWAFQATHAHQALEHDLHGDVVFYTGTLTEAKRSARTHFSALGVRLVAVLS